MFTHLVGLFGTGTAVAGGDFFAVEKYTGNTSDDRDITTTPNIQPNLAIIKKRNGIARWNVVNSIIGPTINLNCADSGLEETLANHIQVFNSDGVELGNDSDVNQSFGTYILYTWRESTGLDIVSYTGNGANRSIVHNLGSVPQMMIVKRRNDSGKWLVYHSGLNRGVTPEQWRLFLDNNTTAKERPLVWNNTAPTASVFTIGTDDEVNHIGDTYIAYLFAAIPGRSAFGRYLGDGETIITTGLGFQPNCVIIKTADDESGGWSIWDSQRGVKKLLRLDVEDKEQTKAGDLDDPQNGLLSFDTDGFTVGDSDIVNRGTDVNHIWCAWK